jgi:hypothetical protein
MESVPHFRLSPTNQRDSTIFAGPGRRRPVVHPLSAQASGDTYQTTSYRIPLFILPPAGRPSHCPLPLPQSSSPPMAGRLPRSTCRCQPRQCVLAQAPKYTRCTAGPKCRSCQHRLIRNHQSPQASPPQRPRPYEWYCPLATTTIPTSKPPTLQIPYYVYRIPVPAAPKSTPIVQGHPLTPEPISRPLAQPPAGLRRPPQPHLVFLDPRA